MSRVSSDEHSSVIENTTPEDEMMHPTQEAVQAELAYRSERMKRDFRASSKWSRRRRQRHTHRKWQLAA
jgi:hypothetical protein